VLSETWFGSISTFLLVLGYFKSLEAIDFLSALAALLDGCFLTRSKVTLRPSDEGSREASGLEMKPSDMTEVV
jgi:hypothetical protein